MELARPHVKACYEYALRSGASASLFVSHIATGIFEIRAESVDRGLERLENALKDSVSLGEQMRVMSLTALVKAYEACGRPEPALRCMRELMQYFSERRKEQINALIAQGYDRPTGKSDEYLDLHAWKYREARLRAAAAEHDVVNARQDMLERLAITASLKEDPSGEHGYRVGKLAALMAKELGWDNGRCYMIEIAARLHDIGKVGIPDNILLGSQQLKDAERHFMRSHTIMGAELLANGDSPQLKMAEEAARSHHEWWDGSGYPKGLAGDRIPVHARIIALADVFDALTHGRPYASPWPKEQALSEIERLSGKQFDPSLASGFVELVRKLAAAHEDLDEFLASSARVSGFLTARKKLKAMLLEEHGHVSQERH